MTKISAYPEIAVPTTDDLLIGTDVETQNQTKNFSIQSVIDLVTLQQVVDSGNTIVVPTTVSDGIDITLANSSTVHQNGISVTIPAQTGEYPTYQPAPDAFVANINGQAPGSLAGSVVGFLASATGDDNVAFFADLTATSGTSRGYEVNSFDAHTGDYFKARKYVLGADSVVFKVANNGDTTAKSFIKTGGTSDQLLRADGSTSTLTNLVTTNTVQTITQSKTFNGGLVFDAEPAAIAMHNRYDMGQSIGITLYDTATDPEGLRVNNNNDNGTAISITNSLSGHGFYGGNNSTGILMTLAASASSTGDLLRCFKNSVITTKVDTNGNITAPSFVKTGGTSAQFLKADGSISTTPTLQQIVDAGNYSENAILIDVASAGNSGPAVSGIAGEDAGVYGQSNTSAGIAGYSNSNYGGYFSSVSSYSLVAAQSAAKPGGGSWSVFSDSRIKENVTPYTKGLADILLINTVTYEYNGLAGTTKGAKYTGVIAQEMKEIFPDTVSTYKAKLNEEDEEKTELYDFNSSDLTFALINAIKELKAEIEILKAK